MARRRRSRGIWFPTVGSPASSVDSQINVSGREIITIQPGTNQIATLITELTYDEDQGGDDRQTQDTSLADIIGSEYVLQRIVGKCFLHRVQRPNATTGLDNGPAYLVGAGFFVARQNDPSSGGGQQQPIGSASVAERNDNYSPLEEDTVREPWIWRRTWILGAAGSVITDGGGAGDQSYPAIIAGFSGYPSAYPASTALYGSVADGPHIDSKVKRRVSGDNRLWFAVSAAAIPLTVAFDNTTSFIAGYLDYRIFGSLRKARQSSAF